MTDQTASPGTMPVVVHGEPVVSAFRHGPLYGQLDDTWTVITQNLDNADGQRRYSVFRARFAPALDRWSIDTNYPVDSGLTWTRAAGNFTSRVTARVS